MAFSYSNTLPIALAQKGLHSRVFMAFSWLLEEPFLLHGPVTLYLSAGCVFFGTACELFSLLYEKLDVPISAVGLLFCLSDLEPGTANARDFKQMAQSPWCIVTPFHEALLTDHVSCYAKAHSSLLNIRTTPEA